MIFFGILGVLGLLTQSGVEREKGDVYETTSLNSGDKAGVVIIVLLVHQAREVGDLIYSSILRTNL
jgi:hypothetical protein